MRLYLFSWLCACGVALAVLTSILDNGICRLIWHRTLGEAALSIEVVTRKGTRVGPGSNLFRSFLHCVGLTLLGSGYLWAIFDGRRETLADYLSGTRLVERE